MSSHRAKILVVGSLVMDMITATERFPDRGATVLGSTFSTAPGGKGANQAVQAAKLGAEVTMFGKVGRDAFGDTLLSAMESAGVDTSWIARSTAPTATGNIILTQKDGATLHNRIIVVPGANMDWTAEDVAPLAENIEQYDMVMLQLEIPMEINRLVVDYAFQKGVPVMLNPAPIADIPEEMLRKLTYLSPNETEAAALLGVSVREEGSALSPEDRAAICDAARTKGLSGLLVTLGDAGAMLVTENSVVYQPCVENVCMVDPTAAGDSFVAAFCAARCWGLDEADALLFANHTAAITVSGMGAMPSLPALEQVLKLMDERKTGTSVMARLREV